MGKRLETVATPVGFLDVAAALEKAWGKLPEPAPSRQALSVLLAQSALETGHWQHSYCYNLGNAKATESWEGDHCFYFADEIVSAAQAEQAAALRAPRTDGQPGHDAVLKAIGNGRVQVTLYPDHPWCRFRGFTSLEAGADDYLGLLYRRFKRAWPAIQAGDPEGFVRTLKELRYFTASVERYLPPVLSLFKKFDEALAKRRPPVAPSLPKIVAVGDRPSLRPVPKDPHVLELQKALKALGYDGVEATGVYGPATLEAVQVFQLQHIDHEGRPLVADGVVGERTWWALLNPSGDAQRNHLSPPQFGGLTEARRGLVELLVAEHAKPVFEQPNGSNRSRDIDRYWGSTGVRGQPWCCAFVSWALHEALGKLPIGGVHHLGVQRMWLAAKKAEMMTTAPKPGDVFVQIKSGGKGHTGFVVGVSADDQTIFTCEGNCGNRLKLGQRARNSIDHFIDAVQDEQGSEFTRGQNLAFDDVSADGTR